MQKQYDSLDTYISLAKKTISKFGPKFYSGLSKEMLMNNEAVSDIATAIMYADWRFDPEREGKSGLKKTLYSYRNQCAIWAMKTYVTNKYKNKSKNKQMSLDYKDEDSSLELLGRLEDKKCIEPIDQLIENESKNELSSNIQSLLSNDLLSEKQKQQIRMYYFDNETLSSIGKKFGVSREAIRQSIKRALEIIKEYK